MRHVVLLNVAEHGYTTFAGAPEDTFVEQPLGIATELVSEGAVAATNELGELVRQPRTPFSITMRHDVGQRPVVAFGAFFARALDDKGRAGLVFVHAIELEDTASLVAVVWGVIKLLAPGAFAEIGDRVAAAAVRQGEADAFFTRYTRQVEATLAGARLTVPSISNAPGALARVDHDCAGAAAIAWLVSAHAMTGHAQGWSTIDREIDGQVLTQFRPEGVERVRVSEILSDTLRDHVARGFYLPMAVGTPAGDPDDGARLRAARMFEVETTRVDHVPPIVDPDATPRERSPSMEPRPSVPPAETKERPAAPPPRVEQPPESPRRQSKQPTRGAGLFVATAGGIVVGAALGFVLGTHFARRAPSEALPDASLDASAATADTPRSSDERGSPGDAAAAPDGAATAALSDAMVDRGGERRLRTPGLPRPRDAARQPETDPILPHGVQ